MMLLEKVFQKKFLFDKGKWGIGLIFKCQLALIERAEEMLEGSCRFDAVNE
jgi:hypothetical protein